MDKSIKTSLSLPQSLRERAQSRANTTHKGNISGYVQQLLQADLESQPAPTAFDDAILTKLAQTYAGYLAKKLGTALEDSHMDQPEILHNLLLNLTVQLTKGHQFEDLVIVPRSEWTPAPYAEPMAAEEPAPYPYKSAAAKPPQKGTDHTGTAPAVPSAG